MALSSQEAAFVKSMILQGNKRWAVRAAFPKLEDGFQESAYNYIMQNPEVQRHIDAGVFYMFRSIVRHITVPEPKPLTYEDKCNMLRLIINGEREKPQYIVTSAGLRMIFVEPSEEDVADAKQMLRELTEAQELQWMM